MDKEKIKPYEPELPIPRWQHKKLTEQALALDDDLKNVVAEYSESGVYDPINNYLRTGKLVNKNVPDEFFQGGFDKNWAKMWISDLDKAVDSSTLGNDTILYRGVGSEVVGKLKKGDIVLDKGFISTSFDSKIAEGFAEKKGAVIKMKVKYTQKGLYVDPVRDLGQSEIILPRNTKMKVTSIRDKGRVINVEIF